MAPLLLCGCCCSCRINLKQSDLIRPDLARSNPILFDQRVGVLRPHWNLPSQLGRISSPPGIAEVQPKDPEPWTCRGPYPTEHLLRWSGRVHIRTLVYTSVLIWHCSDIKSTWSRQFSPDLTHLPLEWPSFGFDRYFQDLKPARGGYGKYQLQSLWYICRASFCGRSLQLEDGLLVSESLVIPARHTGIVEFTVRGTKLVFNTSFGSRTNTEQNLMHSPKISAPKRFSALPQGHVDTLNKKLCNLIACHSFPAGMPETVNK